jgi:hypothetical protein
MPITPPHPTEVNQQSNLNASALSQRNPQGEKERAPVFDVMQP